MGKRSTTSTKSGRAMNLADQARKEARRRELKKNKKQRQVVREAVIKSKDPKKVIEELERLDQMEYNIQEAPPLPDHILAERRKRLLGNFNRCLALYDKEDKTQYSDLKKMLSSYHRKHDETRKYYESVKRAQNVNIEEITLPAAPLEEEIPVPIEPVAPANLRLPVVIGASRTYTWEAFSDDLSDLCGRQPPGPPCCPPPTLSDDSDDEVDVKRDSAEEADSEEEDIEDEEDADNKDEYEQPADPGASRTATADSSQTPEAAKPDILSQRTEAPSTSRDVRPPGSVPPFAQPGVPNFRNVPPPSLQNMRFAPPPRLGNPAMNRMMMMRPPNFPPNSINQIGPIRPGTVGGVDNNLRPPVYGQPNVSPAEPKATIAAKPQLRNTMAEVTRLVPTSVKVKREEPIKPKPKPVGILEPNVELIPHRPAGNAQQPSKGSADQAYEDFMKEMQGFL